MFKNENLKAWVKQMEKLCKPADVYVCDGSQEEYNQVCAELVSKKAFVPLNPEKRPNSYWCRSDPDDVARVEECTFICSKKEEDAGPTNNWADPVEMHAKMLEIFDGCMEGRRTYVILFSMGPLGSDIAQIGVQITDSPYMVANMRIMMRMGSSVLDVSCLNF